MKLFFLTWGLIILSAFLDSYAAAVVKSKFNELGTLDYSSWKSVYQYLLHFVKSPILITAVIAFITAPVLWFFALNRMELTTAYPALVGLHLFFVLIAGLFFFGESFSLNKAIGLIMVLGSLYFFYKS